MPYPTSKCFRKNPKDIINATKARFHLKKQPIARYKAIDKYLEQRVGKIIKDQLTNFGEKAIEIIDGWSKKNKKRTVDFFALLLFNVDIYFYC